MNLEAITEARDDLAATLSDSGYPVYGYEQPKVVSGSIILDEGEPFLEYGDVFGTFRINFEVLLFQSTKNLAAATKAMDEMVIGAVWNLGEWTLTNLESHRTIQLQENGPIWLVSKLSVTNLLEIGA